MPPPIHRFGGRLLEQQVWCWGRDVERRDGNLLMEFGFERHRDSEGYDRSTCYRLDQDDIHVCLWGFGMFFGNRRLGGLYLDRFDFRPVWAPIESLSLDVHWPEDLPDFARPRGMQQWRKARELWKESLMWIADYEGWIRDAVGLDYRRECVETWLRPFVKADKAVDAWRYLGGQSWDKTVTQRLKKFIF